jgi:4-amino-4-deoxy-L-arabinose transferase-like glycosyltransferase
MPVLQKSGFAKGLALPPSGWALTILLVLYIFTGLIGHDPWRTDDAITIGIVHDIVTNGHWLNTSLAGRPYADAPLYYWIAAACAHLFAWLLPLHDATRLASGISTLLALSFILLAARELHGKAHAAAAPLILAGSIGFLYHAHEAQPMLAALTAHTAAYWGLSLLNRQAKKGAGIFGLALGLGFLANGLAPVLTLLPTAAFVLWRSENRKQAVPMLLGSVLIAFLLAALWLVPLFVIAPEFFADFWKNELNQLSIANSPFNNIQRYLALLPWYAWPALPLAGWALWAKRRILHTLPLAWPIFSFVTTLLVLSLCLDARSAPALLLLPPLVLLAVPGVTSLRRGAANAFDWFGMITFTTFAGLAWVIWSAMVFGWPERLARQAVRIEPGFVGQLNIITAIFALLMTLIWCWLIATSPRSPMRGIMHWMAGLTLFWLLIATLWMPWIDYGKTYRPVSASLAAALGAKHGCVANANVNDAVLASLDYFDGLRTVPLKSAAGKRCDWLLIHGLPREANANVTIGWKKTWEGGRPTDRHETEKFRLYRRDIKTDKKSAGTTAPK